MYVNWMTPGPSCTVGNIYSWKGAKYWDVITVSVCSHISKTTHPNFIKFSVCVACSCGTDFLWRQCSMLCTSRFGYYQLTCHPLPCSNKCTRPPRALYGHYVLFGGVITIVYRAANCVLGKCLLSKAALYYTCSWGWARLNVPPNTL